MKPGSTIMVDVDLTVVDTLSPWLAWFKELTGVDFQRDTNQVEYDLVPHMKKLATEAGHPYLNPMGYWTDYGLYNDLQPMPGCQEKLEMFKWLDCEIIFVSKCEPEHYRSKREFLKKYFPYHDAFIDTGDKQYIDYDVMIDDNITMLEAAKVRHPQGDYYLLTQISDAVFPYITKGHPNAVKSWEHIH